MSYILRYGENPQSTAELINEGGNDELSLFNLKNPDGTDLDFSTFSYINVSDTDRMLNTVTHIAASFANNFSELPRIAVAVKHGHICGAGIADNTTEALKKMYEGDKRAVFGGFLMTNFKVDKKEIETLLESAGGKMFLAGIIAPEITESAVNALPKQKRKCQLAILPALSSLSIDSISKNEKKRPIRGGYILENRGEFLPSVDDFASEINEEIASDLLLAWAVGSTSVSNTITIVKDGQVIGNGVGQQDRVGAAELAVKRARDAGHDLSGALAYSDSFFPFPDGIEVLANAGIKTVFATSGSVKDKIVKKFAKENGVKLILVPDKEARGFFGH